MKSAPSESKMVYEARDIATTLGSAVRLGAKGVTPATEIGELWAHWA